MLTVSASAAWSTLCSADTARMRRWTSRGPIGRSARSSSLMTRETSNCSRSSFTRRRSAAMASTLIEYARGMRVLLRAERAHDGQEVLEAGETQHHVRALLVADGRARPIGVVVAGVEERLVGQRAEHLGQAAVHVLGVRAGQVDTPARPDEQRVARH